MRKSVPIDRSKKRKKPVRILFIEPDEASSDLIRKNFSKTKRSYLLTFSRTLHEAREALETSPPDLVISAWKLPDGKGIEILGKENCPPRFPLVILADRKNQRAAEEVLRFGAIDYIVKSKASLEGLPFIAERALRSWDTIVAKDALQRVALEQATRFRLLVENIGAGIGYYDLNGITLFYNQTAASFMGGRPEDFIGKSVHDIFDRPLADTILQRILRASVSPGQASEYDDEVILPAGKRWFHSIYSSVTDETGNVTGVQIVSTDITEKKNLERKAEEFRKRISDILNSLPDATFAIDKEGNVIAWNRAIEAMTGIPADQMLGKGNFAYSIPFYGERRPILIDLVLKREEEIEKKYLYMHRDGEQITSETYIQGMYGGKGAHLWGTAVPLYDSAGRRAGAIEVIRDITDRKNTEEALSRSSKLLNQTQELTHVGGWEYDIPSSTITWTDEVYRIYEVTHDYDPNNIKGDIAFYSPEDREVLEEAFRRAVEEGIPYDLELRFVSQSGKKKWVKTTARVEYADGRPVRLIGNILDITDRKDAESRIETLLAEVQNEKEWLSSLLDSIPDEVWFTDTSHRFTLANPRAREEFALQEHETPLVEALAGSLEVYRPDGSPRPIGEAPPLRALAGELITDMEEIIRSPRSGELRYRQVSSSPVKDTSGTIIGSVSVVRDITALKDAEAKVRESNERFTLVSKATNDTIWDWDLVTDDLWWNEGIRTVFGYPPDEEEPRITSWYQKIHPGDRERVVGGIHAAIDKGENVWSDEYRFRRADGSYAQVFDRGYVIRDGKGAAIRMVGAMLDLTERLRMVDALRESEQRYHAILEDQTEFICRFRPDGIYVFVNDAYARYFGKAREELIGKIFKPDIFPQDRRKVRDIFNSLTPDHPATSSEHRIVMPDGTVRWQQWSDRAIFDDSGNVKEYQSVGRDITAQKEAEEALRENEERFRNLFLHIHAGVVIYEAVRNGEDFIIKEINPAVERIEKVKKDEVIGRSVLEAFPGVKEFGLFDVFQEVWRTGVPIAYPVSFYRDERISGWRDNFVSRLPSGEIVAIYDDVTEKKQAEEALKASEEKYRSIFENAAVGIYQITPEGKFITANDRAAQILGYETGDELIRSITSIDTQIYRDPGMRKEAARKMYEEGILKNFEVPCIHKDGSTVWVSFSAKPVRDTDGRIIRHDGISIDITERKRIEEEQKKNQDRLEKAMEMGNIAWWEMELPFGAVRFHDRKATILGYSPEQFLTYQDFCALLHPDDYERTMNAMRDHLEGRAPRYDVEYRIRTSGNEWRWFHDSGGITSRDPVGSTIVVTGMVVDITSIKAAEEQFREAERRFEEVITHSPDSIFVLEVTVEGHFRMLYMNPVSEQDMGISNASASGKLLNDIFPEDTSRYLSSRYYECAERGSPLHYEEIWERPEGRQYYSTTLVPLKDPVGRTTRIIGLSHNITNLKMMESEVRALNTVLEQRVIERTRELEEANRALHKEIEHRKAAEEKLRTSLDEKLTLLREVHHRVKNNLQIIVSLLNLQARYITDEGTLAAIRESQNRVRAMALVHEKLYQTENLSQIDLDGYLRYLGKGLFQFYGATSRGITFSTDLEGIVVDINTAIPFGLIMNELISNSLKYGFPEKRRGTVSIRVRREGHTLHVEYRDTGVGIPDGLDWKNTPTLGLRLVNSLVSQLNGSIELDRSVGTVFSMVLQEKE